MNDNVGIWIDHERARSETLSECMVAVATADKLTDPQIVAKVKEHFGIVR